jgi:6-phosphofructokinase
VPTISNDRIYCKILAHNAVHAAFGGYTGITVVRNEYCKVRPAMIAE